MISFRCTRKLVFEDYYLLDSAVAYLSITRGHCWIGQLESLPSYLIHFEEYDSSMPISLVVSFVLINLLKKFSETQGIVLGAIVIKLQCCGGTSQA